MSKVHIARGAFVFSLLLSLLVIAMPVPVHAQAAMTGTVSGTAQDTSGGVLVNADVTLKNESSGDIRRSKTNAQGVFVITGLRPGSYALTVAYTGFQTTERKGLVLHPGDRINLSDMKLSVGAGEQITVEAGSAALTPTDTGEKSFTITAEQIQNIATVGRDVSELIKILPGVIPITGSNNRPGFTGELVGLKPSGGNAANNVSANAIQSSFSVSGVRPDAIDVTVDGAPASDRTRVGNLQNPNTEMTQEFKALFSAFSAEHSRGPVAITAVSKSGGRQYHGTLYTSLRDYHLNANDWSQNKQGLVRPKTKFAYPGFNVGGPLMIPGTKLNKNRDKAFFFLGVEYAFQEFDYFRRGWTYSPEMLNGDFRNANWLAASRNDNVSTVPKGGFVNVDPAGAKLAALYPQATVTTQAALATNGGYNYVANPTRKSNMLQILGRIDYSISDNTKLFLRYNRQREAQDQPISVYGEQSERFLPWPTPIDGKNFSDSLSATLTHVFSPTSTLEVVGSYTRYGLRNDAQDYTRMTKATVGFPYPFYWDQPVIPNIQGDASPWIGGQVGPMMFNPGGGTTISQDKKFFTFAAHFTKVAGTHTFKVGANADLAQDTFMDPWISNGEIILARVGGQGQESWGNWSQTDNVLADLVSGYASGWGQDYNLNPKSYRGRNVEGFIQDSWKVRPNLTLDAGVRLSYLGPWEDKNGIGPGVWMGRAAYDADIAQYGDNYRLPGVRWHARDSSVPLSGIKRSTLFASPRFGFAWDIKGTGRTVVRGGIGVYRYMEEAFRLTEMLESPSANWNYSNAGDARSFAKLQEEADAYRRAATANNNQPPKPGKGWGATVWLKDDKKLPVSYNWNFTVQQRLPLSMVVEASYVGNRQENLLLGTGDQNMGNINFAPGFAGTKPYANLDNLSVVSHALYQNYHAGQFSLARQKGPFTFLLAYTFSKNLGFRGYGYGSGQYAGQLLDPDYSKRVAQLRKTDYGVLGFDRTHVVNFSYNYNLPALKGKPLPARLLLGGWQISGVTTFLSGQPLQAQRANFGMSGTNADGIRLRPTEMITGFPPNTENTLNFSLYPNLTCDPRKNVPAGYYFNTKCFAAPAANTYGIGMMPDMRGPSYVNHDLSLFKNFPLGGMRKLQLRLSAFNLLNHAVTSFTDETLRLTFDRGVISNSAFGKIPVDVPVTVNGKTYMTGANKYGRRVVQASLKFFF